MSEDPPGGDFLCLRGALKRAQGQASQAQDKEANKIDRENQLVVKKKEVEEEETVLRGKARRSEGIPKDSVTQSLKGLFLLEGTSDVNFSIGEEIEMRFKGTVGGKMAEFSGIIGEITYPIFVKNGHKYIKVKILRDQIVPIDHSKSKVSILANDNSLIVKVK